MYDHVLVPTDGNETARRAAEHAIALASELDSTVHAISVVESAGAVQRDQMRADPEAEAEEAVGEVKRGATEAGVEASTTVREGPAADEIRDHIAEHRFDLIVMGTDNRTGLDRVLDHSVAEDVLENSTVPVLTVPNPEPE
ncbi:universal stress protein [Halovivax gelatinilyticus]|uniref:universal stress protein n=1 Tax=Halovivax gelatinilyticus TaxID=2961597 RepID=UPI0020CA506C|nr:universal stress protein [Halovivax gelatinilyticus]